MGNGGRYPTYLSRQGHKAEHRERTAKTKTNTNEACLRGKLLYGAAVTM